MRRVDVRLRWAPTSEVVVGTLAEAPRGPVVFEYADEFLETGMEISPWKLPAQPGLIEHTDHNFGPIFGTFDDSLPDGWGLLLMDRHLRRTGREPSGVSVLERLLYMGNDGMGALTYHPATTPSVSAPGTRLDLGVLAKEAEQVLQGADIEVLPELYRVGGSPAGARPKVLVGARGAEIISGVEDLPEGWEHWLVKFSNRPDTFDAGAFEYAYMRMAELAGVQVPPHRLFADGRFFGVQRFDRFSPNRRLHMHTLGGLTQSNFRHLNSDYDILLRVARRLTADRRAVVEVVRRMVFNVVAHNRDDHVKNFAFLMDAEGMWTMSPAYDLSCSGGPRGEHSMTIGGEGRDPTLANVTDVAERHGLKRSETLAIVEEVNDAVAKWPELARDSGCPKKPSSAVAKLHRFLRVPAARPTKKRRSSRASR